MLHFSWKQPHGDCESDAEWMFISRLAHSAAEPKSRDPRCLHGQFEITEGRDGHSQRSRVVGASGLMARICSMSVMVDPEMTKPGFGTSDLKCRDIVERWLQGHCNSTGAAGGRSGN
jgi:hypothetical protein